MARRPGRHVEDDLREFRNLDPVLGEQLAVAGTIRTSWKRRTAHGTGARRVTVNLRRGDMVRSKE